MLNKLVVSAALLALLSACMSHHTDSATSAEFSKSDTGKSVSTLPELETVYDEATRQNPNPSGLREVDINNLKADEKLVVQLRPNFAKQIQLCKADACEEIIPKQSIDSGLKTAGAGGGDELEGVDQIIAEVLPNKETTQKFGVPLPIDNDKKNILVMPIDIELNEVGASGVKTPNAFWTDIAANYVNEFTAQYFTKTGFNVAFVEKGALGISAKEVESLKKLNSQVGLSIMLFQQDTFLQLPSFKGKPLDWPLGNGTKVFKEKYGANYGLFVYLRDDYASGSRVAAGILAALIFGGGAVQPTFQVGFATLVDLETGKLVWFNKLVSTSADLRTFDAALETTDALYRDMPF